MIQWLQQLKNISPFNLLFQELPWVLFQLMPSLEEGYGNIKLQCFWALMSGQCNIVPLFCDCCLLSILSEMVQKLYDTPGVHLHHRQGAVVPVDDLPVLAPRSRLKGRSFPVCLYCCCLFSPPSASAPISDLLC